MQPEIITSTLGVVHVAEDLGLPPRLSPLLGLVIATLLAILGTIVASGTAALATAWPTDLQIGLVDGLSAFGLYQAGPAIRPALAAMSGRPVVSTARPPSPTGPPAAAS